MASWRDNILDQAEAIRQRSADFDLDALRREDEAESGGFFSGFGLGIVVGAVLALVFAPKRGDETREIVSERAVQLKDKASGLIAQARGGDDEPEETLAAIERDIDDLGTTPIVPDN
ncbi:MAG: YtxH domain-containing protein [Thermomicrobiales bacterium]